MTIFLYLRQNNQLEYFTPYQGLFSLVFQSIFNISTVGNEDRFRHDLHVFCVDIVVVVV